jgi:hypothetical protein
LNFRYGVTRFIQHDRPQAFPFNLASLGFPDSLLKLLDPSLTSFPAIVPEGYASLGGTLRRQNRQHASCCFGDSVQRARHAYPPHGREFRSVMQGSYDYGQVSPRIEFGTLWTRGPLDNSPAAPIGQGMAALLLGLPTGGYIDRNPARVRALQLLRSVRA